MEAAARSGIVGAFIAGFFLASCAGPAAQPVAHIAQPIVAEAPPVSIAIPVTAAQETIEPPQRSVIDQLQRAAHLSIVCSAGATQGGAILCDTAPGATVSLDGKPIARADGEGVAIVGLTRTAPAQVKISARAPGSDYDLSTNVDVLPRHDTVTSFTMDCGKIAPQGAEDKRKAEVAWVKKDKALKSFNDPVAPFALQGPVRLEGVAYSSSFGATRTYIPKTKACEPKTNVHNGTDIAVGTGTEIRAPMAGTVILADPDLFYEGGCVFLDLGRGLVSVTMHMSRIDVKPGDRVEQGQLLGLSGATGSVTGPHLHWAIKYRNVFSEDRGADIWLDPMLMMSLKSPQ
ncbi:MAG: M23 family metallopeptidase [Hyphomonadaceae bacterium]